MPAHRLYMCAAVKADETGRGGNANGRCRCMGKGRGAGRANRAAPKGCTGQPAVMRRATSIDGACAVDRPSALRDVADALISHERVPMRRCPILKSSRACTFPLALSVVRCLHVWFGRDVTIVYRGIRCVERVFVLCDRVDPLYYVWMCVCERERESRGQRVGRVRVGVGFSEYCTVPYTMRWVILLHLDLQRGCRK